MKHLKHFHLMTGLLALILVFASVTGLYQLSSVPDSLSSPAIAVLIAAALLNLMTGACVTAHRGYRRLFQVIGSILLIAGLAGATGFAYNNALLIAGTALDHMALITLISGTLIHAFANLDTVFASHSNYTEASDRETGTVKWFNVTKGFGFITRDVGDDVFVHYRAIRGEGHRTLSEGQRVEFVVVDKDKGMQAEDVIAAQKGR